MTKAVYRPQEVAVTNLKVVLDPPFAEAKNSDGLEELEEAVPVLEDVYEGPTADQLRAEAERFKADWDVEKESMINAANAEAALILNDAKSAAEEKIKAAQEEAEEKIKAAQEEADKLKNDAEAAAREISGGAKEKFESEKKLAYEEGLTRGKDEGYASGKAEAERLITRIRTIMERIQDKRAEVLAETEQQIIDLALLIARKVVKSISEHQRDVVIENVKEALKKVKARGNIIIKVNLADLQLTTAHIDEFVKLVESGGNIEIHEDSSVDSGGCIIETDFGEIDARIASQFAELESKVLELSPIRGGGK